MIDSGLKRMAPLICSCLICSYATAACAFAWQVEPTISQIRRIYVAPFAIKGGTGQLQGDVVSQLHKLGTVKLVSNEADADAVLSGAGEVWIRGYESLNPRSGRSPSNGTPVYGGFVSVELKDRAGDTLWSDLVTARAASGGISKDVSKQVAKHLAQALQGSGSSSASHH